MLFERFHRAQRRVLILGGIFLACVAPAQAAPAFDDPRMHQHLDRVMAAYVEQDQVGHISYGLWQKGVLITDGFHGVLHDQRAEPLNEHTIHRIYSMTKPITAVGLLILLERGYFHLDDPITDVLPEFEALRVVADTDEDGVEYTYETPRAPTFRQLLSHTAGFGTADRSNRTQTHAAAHASHLTLSPNTDDLVKNVAQTALISEPGAEWNYSVSSDLQGAIIERLTGESLARFLDREIFMRLNMYDTGFFVSQAQSPRVAGVTQRSDDEGLRQATLEPLTEAAQSQFYFEGGHGLVSTLSDYHKFLEMLQRGGRVGQARILQASTVATLQTNAVRFRGAPAPTSSNGRQNGLGYGFGVGTIEDPERAQMAAPAGTYFWTGALGTWFWVDPSNDIIFIGMVQTRTPCDQDLTKASMAAIYGTQATH